MAKREDPYECPRQKGDQLMMKGDLPQADGVFQRWGKAWMSQIAFVGHMSSEVFLGHPNSGMVYNGNSDENRGVFWGTPILGNYHIVIQPFMCVEKGGSGPFLAIGMVPQDHQIPDETGRQGATKY